MFIIQKDHTTFIRERKHIESKNNIENDIEMTNINPHKVTWYNIQ